MAKVSIITPTYNSSKTLNRAVGSIFHQTYANWELFIVDDGSLIPAADILNDFYLKDDRVHIIRFDKNEGVAAARNVGIEKATGDYMAFLDADDYWLPHKLEMQCAVLDSGFVNCCHSSYYRSNGKYARLRECKQTVSAWNMKYHNYVGNLTGIYNASKIGKVYQHRINHEDYQMWIDVVEKSGYSFGISEPTSIYSVSKNSLSSNKFKSFIWYFDVLNQNNNKLFSFCFTLIHFGILLFEKIFRRI